MRILFLFIILLLPAPAVSQDNPTSYIRANVDKVVSILTSPEYEAETNKTEQLRQIEAVVDNFFDAEELSKRSLGQYWRIFTPEQKQEFQPLFLKLIKQVYLKKSITYNDEVVNYNQEIIKSDTLAEVHTTITSPNLNIPIIYYMIRKDVSWKVYDVSVENVSLIKNYRSQFRSILQNNSPDKLIATLREKTNE
ncbi:phospholipid transport system substrate-binding protein [Desulfomicrobium norvegicum]|uniref:Phospholipid transport system substrate-binding protein n=1 Tax=Desulfomicrobium norvegicum (strain DSM 1741 / NCIMB 8310) TaxID=52561 RepID=A0A8G2C5E9_DESNO|nr:ABC transporter substrate-binding protein [Desulfomicrobium norvegicum]SFM10507.1 phospholipid transport system substrate-binding protein [Desulfomicrobium norvegicum]